MTYNMESLYIPLSHNEKFRTLVISLIPRIYSFLKWMTLFLLFRSYVRLMKKFARYTIIALIITGASISFIIPLGLINDLADELLFTLLLTIVLFDLKSSACNRSQFFFLITPLLPMFWFKAFIDISGLFAIDPGIWIYHRLIVFFLYSLFAFMKMLISEGENAKRPDLEKYFDRHGISNREREVFSLLADHSSYKEIMDELHISLDTVKSHARSIYRKSGVKNRNELLRQIKTEETI